jgi:S-adenosylmethionine:tRNA ribosyltransferase-isomerase
MKLSDYEYNLPQHLIVDRPPTVRGTSRLLVLLKNSSEIIDNYYSNVAEYLNSNDLLVINNTRVLPARLIVQTSTGAERELLLLEKHGNSKDEHTSLVMYRRKISNGQELTIKANIIRVKEVYNNGTALVTSDSSLWEIAEKYGSMPLPPYMHRLGDESDKDRYQTEFASQLGSVAAPTASLNMTTEILKKIKGKGVSVAELTLHVGLGTFMPIRVNDVEKHRMHQEYFEIPLDTAEAIRKTKEQGGRVFAVGTTVTRTLEYAADQILCDKLDYKNKTINGEADIFIYPGFEFQIVDGLLTNFHAPHSTVLMMAAAFAGWDNLKRSYEHAVQQNYKFLSYGDSMLIL